MKEAKPKEDSPLSLKEGVGCGFVWFLSYFFVVGLVGSVITWSRHGFISMPESFSFIGFIGAGLFAFIVFIALTCELLNFTDKYSRRFGLVSCFWAFVFSCLLGGIGILSLKIF